MSSTSSTSPTVLKLSDLPSFRMIVLGVIESLLHESINSQMSLSQITEIVNEHPLISLVLEKINYNTPLDTLKTVALADVVRSITKVFKSSDVRIDKDNKDSFHIQMTRQEYEEFLLEVETEYREDMLAEIKNIEMQYFEKIQKIDLIENGKLDEVLIKDYQMKIRKNPSISQPRAFNSFDAQNPGRLNNMVKPVASRPIQSLGVPNKISASNFDPAVLPATPTTLAIARQSATPENKPHSIPNPMTLTPIQPKPGNIAQTLASNRLASSQQRAASLANSPVTTPLTPVKLSQLPKHDIKPYPNAKATISPPKSISPTLASIAPATPRNLQSNTSKFQVSSRKPSLTSTEAIESDEPRLKPTLSLPPRRTSFSSPNTDLEGVSATPPVKPRSASTDDQLKTTAVETDNKNQVEQVGASVTNGTPSIAHVQPITTALTSQQQSSVPIARKELVLPSVPPVNTSPTQQTFQSVNFSPIHETPSKQPLQRQPQQIQTKPLFDAPSVVTKTPPTRAQQSSLSQVDTSSRTINQIPPMVRTPSGQAINPFYPVNKQAQVKAATAAANNSPSKTSISSFTPIKPSGQLPDLSTTPSIVKTAPVPVTVKSEESVSKEKPLQTPVESLSQPRSSSSVEDSLSMVTNNGSIISSGILKRSFNDSLDGESAEVAKVPEEAEAHGEPSLKRAKQGEEPGAEKDQQVSQTEAVANNQAPHDLKESIAAAMEDVEKKEFKIETSGSSKPSIEDNNEEKFEDAKESISVSSSQSSKGEVDSEKATELEEQELKVEPQVDDQKDANKKVDVDSKEKIDDVSENKEESITRISSNQTEEDDAEATDVEMKDADVTAVEQKTGDEGATNAKLADIDISDVDPKDVFKSGQSLINDETDEDEHVEEEEEEKQKSITALKKSKTPTLSQLAPSYQIPNKKLSTLAQSILDTLSAHKLATPFLQPVASSITDYDTLIKEPRDFKTIKHMIKDGRIQTKEELERDILLMFANAVMFNESGDEVAEWAKVLAEECTKVWEMFEENLNDL